MIQELGGVAGLIALIGAVFRINGSRISKKQDKNMCETLHGQVKIELERGSKNFEAIHNKLDEVNRTLASLDKSVALLARNSRNHNGVLRNGVLRNG